jgi:hypothetical protein
MDPNWSLSTARRAVFLPLLLVIMGRLFSEPRANLAILIYLSALGLLSAQPDAASATAFGIAGLVLIGFNRPADWQSGILALCVFFLVAWAWQQLDPLGRVPYVEDIVSVAAKRGWYWGAGVIVALAFVPLSLLLLSTDEKTGISERSLAISPSRLPLPGLEISRCLLSGMALPL